MGFTVMRKPIAPLQGRQLIRILACSFMIVAGLTDLHQPPTVRAAGIPAGLPSHFGIGLSASPSSSGIYGWMPNSGIPWDYAYQYLAGGVNTGTGWETWNTSGQFALWYAQGAASHHYIPVFSYYELLQSNGTCGSCGENQKDISNLNNAGLMSSYFQNFALLMKRLGSSTYDGIAGFGHTAIVHVEPDLSGYTEQAVNNNGLCFGYCTGQGNNPSLLRAAVAGSGDADVAGYPNTYQGFNWAVLHLRDLYAPNVLLAFHVSDWATGSDVGSDTGTSLNAAALGQQAGSFAAQSGVNGVPSGTSTYDLLFNDVSDRDAGYYKYVYGRSNAFWDRLNVTFPNFHRWEAYISAAGQAMGRPAFVWQIPEGNQYFDTVNNTNGHYQDNRAEYFFAHIGELVQSGIIGLLFGAGNAGSTGHTDAMNDGITNPPSFCTTDGLSSGQICNNHTSTVSDDDGGYIRMEGQQYFAAGGYPLNGSAPTATATAPATATSTPGGPATATPTTPAVATGTATAAAIQVSISGTGANPQNVSAGQSTVLKATAQSNALLSNPVIDFEVYSGSGAKVFQTWQSPASLPANSAQTYTATWVVPVTQTVGTYTLKVGVFGSGWAPLYAWDNGTATINVGGGATPTISSTSTPFPATATTIQTATDTPAPPTATRVPTGTWTPSATPVPPTATATPAQPTSTPVPPTATNTPPPPTATNSPIPPTATVTTVPPTLTSTPVPPTTTPVPPTATYTAVPPTATNTPQPPAATNTADLPTATAVPPTATATPAPPTNTPPPTATGTTLTFSFVKVTESATSIKAGGTETFAATITASRSVSNELVDFEVYNSLGHKVWQAWRVPVSFTTSVAQTITMRYQTPTNLPNGIYTLKLGVFTSAWVFQAWDSSGAVFGVGVTPHLAGGRLLRAVESTPVRSVTVRSSATPHARMHHTGGRHRDAALSLGLRLKWGLRPSR